MQKQKKKGNFEQEDKASQKVRETFIRYADKNEIFLRIQLQGLSLDNKFLLMQAFNSGNQTSKVIEELKEDENIYISLATQFLMEKFMIIETFKEEFEKNKRLASDAIEIKLDKGVSYKILPQFEEIANYVVNDVIDKTRFVCLSDFMCSFPIYVPEMIKNGKPIFKQIFDNYFDMIQEKTSFQDLQVIGLNTEVISILMNDENNLKKIEELCECEQYARDNVGEIEKFKPTQILLTEAIIELGRIEEQTVENNQQERAV